METFRCTAIDSAEKKLEKYFEEKSAGLLSRVPGEMSIVSSLDQFRRNLDAFSGGQLKYLNWESVCVRHLRLSLFPALTLFLFSFLFTSLSIFLQVIGGAVGACLLPIPSHFVGQEDRYFSKEGKREKIQREVIERSFHFSSDFLVWL
jgi:hypothetical protein